MSTKKKTKQVGGVVKDNKPIPSAADDMQAHESDAAAMKKCLEAQPKVEFWIPLEHGEKDGAFVPVTINGYRLNVKKGVSVPIPEQVAEMLRESLNIQSVASADKKIDRDTKTEKALS